MSPPESAQLHEARGRGTRDFTKGILQGATVPTDQVAQLGDGDIVVSGPRWTTIDAKVFGVERPQDVPASIQERAYTSPVWYTPN